MDVAARAFIAVPKPRTSQRKALCDPSDATYEMFSTSAKPAPIANPCMAVSTRKPVLRVAIR